MLTIKDIEEVRVRMPTAERTGTLAIVAALVAFSVCGQESAVVIEKPSPSGSATSDRPAAKTHYYPAGEYTGSMNLLASVAAVAGETIDCRNAVFHQHLLNVKGDEMLANCCGVPAVIAKLNQEPYRKAIWRFRFGENTM